MKHTKNPTKSDCGWFMDLSAGYLQNIFLHWQPIKRYSYMYCTYSMYWC